MVAIEWKQPSQCLYMKDDFVHEHIPQKLLVEALNLHYLHPSLLNSLNPSLRSQLGIKSLNMEHLKEVARVLLRYFHKAVSDGEAEEIEDELFPDYEDDEDDYHFSKVCMGSLTRKSKEEKSRDLMVGWVARWLACVHIVVEGSNTLARMDLLDKIKDLCILPLEDGSFVPAGEDGTIFFPPDNFKSTNESL